VRRLRRLQVSARVDHPKPVDARDEWSRSCEIVEQDPARCLDHTFDIPRIPRVVPAIAGGWAVARDIWNSDQTTAVFPRSQWSKSNTLLFVLGLVFCRGRSDQISLPKVWSEGRREVRTCYGSIANGVACRKRIDCGGIEICQMLSRLRDELIAIEAWEAFSEDARTQTEKDAAFAREVRRQMIKALLVEIATRN